MSSALRPGGSSRKWRVLRAVVLSEEPVCRWCQNAPTTHVDHIIPRARGGDDRRENLCGACGPCNLARGDGMPVAPPSADW
ncbi:HNH endonuclease [Streptomyces synnematoformans]|uniref:HNH endonuclease n=1 Tax=Streptomyces synnematoformans TaxID=415721 RepID=UPI003CD0B23C